MTQLCTKSLKRNCKIIRYVQFSSNNFDEAKTFMEQFNELRPYNEVAEWPFAIDTETGENL